MRIVFQSKMFALCSTNAHISFERKYANAQVSSEMDFLSAAKKKTIFLNALAFIRRRSHVLYIN